VKLRIAGIDPGLRHLGVGILDAENDSFSTVYTGVVSPPVDAWLDARLFQLYNELKELFRTYEPEVVALEEAFYGRNIKTALLMGHVRGAVMVAAREVGLEVKEYAARKIKSAVTGNGAATKDQVAFMIKRLVKGAGEISSLDVSDALAVAMCHALNAHRWEGV